MGGRRGLDRLTRPARSESAGALDEAPGKRRFPAELRRWTRYGGRSLIEARNRGEDTRRSRSGRQSADAGLDAQRRAAWSKVASRRGLIATVTRGLRRA